MKYDAFEKYIKESLTTGVEEVNIEALIASINKEKSNRRRKLILLWGTSIFTVGIIFSSFWIVREAYISNRTPKDLNVSYEVNLDDISKQKHNNNPKSGHSTYTMTPTFEIEKTTKNFYNTPNNRENLSNNQVKAHSTYKLNSSHANNFQTQPINVIDQSMSQIDYSEDSKYTEQHSPTTSLIGITKKENLKMSLTVASMLPILTPTVLEKSTTNSFEMKNNKIICPNFNRKNRISIDVGVHADLFKPFKQLSVTKQEHEHIMVKRNEIEKSLEGYTLGVDLYLRSNKYNVYARTGLDRTKITEKSNLSYEYKYKDTIQGILSITKSQSGDTVTIIYGDIEREYLVQGQKVRYYTLIMYDLPLGIGYEKRWHNWSVFGEVGTVINLVNQSKGHLFGGDTLFTDLQVDPSYFQRRLGLNPYLQGGVGYSLGNYGRLLFSVRYRYFPTKFSTEVNPVVQKYQFGGMQVSYILPI